MHVRLWNGEGCNESTVISRSSYWRHFFTNFVTNIACTMALKELFEFSSIFWGGFFISTTSSAPSFILLLVDLSRMPG